MLPICPTTPHRVNNSHFLATDEEWACRTEAETQRGKQSPSIDYQFLIEGEAIYLVSVIHSRLLSYYLVALIELKIDQQCRQQLARFTQQKKTPK